MKRSEIALLGAGLALTSFVQVENTRAYEIEASTYFAINIESGIPTERQDFYTEALNEFAVGLSQLPPEVLTHIEGHKIQIVIFQTPEFLAEYTEEAPLARVLFEQVPELANSGVDDTLWVNEASAIWEDYDAPTQKAFIGGEIFRVIQARLGVDINNPQTNNYALNIPDWFFFGSPLSWAAAQMEDGDQVLFESQDALVESEVNPLQLREPGSLQAIYDENPESYAATTALVETLIQEYGVGDHSLLFVYYQLLGEGKTSDEAFFTTFGITLEDFENSFTNQVER